VIGISGGGSSRRPRSVKNCRARGRTAENYIMRTLIVCRPYALPTILE
jgi:hypothetical protein